MIRVSIIIPVHNVERYLGECLDSVLGQTLRAIEVICVDDGSTDGSLRLLEEYARRDARLSVIRQANAGAALSRNAALARTTGEFVAFMDADDLYPSADILERLYAAATSAGAWMCGGRMEHRLPDGRVQPVAMPPHWGFTTYLYSRQLLMDGAVRFPSYRVFEDPPFLVAALARAGERVAKVDFSVYRYRVAYRTESEKAQAVMNAVGDYIRGITDVVNLSHEANLAEIYEAVRDYCRSQEFLVIAMRAIRRTDDALPLLCRLGAAFPDDVRLPIFQDLQAVYRRSDGPWKTLAYALWQFKARMGSRLPNGIKFWRKR